jgi:hypothetical protein
MPPCRPSGRRSHLRATLFVRQLRLQRLTGRIRGLNHSAIGAACGSPRSFFRRFPERARAQRKKLHDRKGHRQRDHRPVGAVPAGRLEPPLEGRALRLLGRLVGEYGERAEHQQR